MKKTFCDACGCEVHGQKLKEIEDIVRDALTSTDYVEVEVKVNLGAAQMFKDFCRPCCIAASLRGLEDIKENVKELLKGEDKK